MRDDMIIFHYMCVMKISKNKLKINKANIKLG